MEEKKHNIIIDTDNKRKFINRLIKDCLDNKVKNVTDDLKLIKSYSGLTPLEMYLKCSKNPRIDVAEKLFHKDFKKVPHVINQMFKYNVFSVELAEDVPKVILYSGLLQYSIPNQDEYYKFLKPEQIWFLEQTDLSNIIISKNISAFKVLLKEQIDVDFSLVILGMVYYKWDSDFIINLIEIYGCPFNKKDFENLPYYNLDNEIMCNIIDYLCDCKEVKKYVRGGLKWECDMYKDVYEPEYEYMPVIPYKLEHSKLDSIIFSNE